MKKRNTLLLASLLSFLFLFQGCDLIFNVASSIVDNFIIVEPGQINPIKAKAFQIADKYTREDTKYKPGASGRFVYPFDCSGFVERCYEEALIGTGLRLPFDLQKNGHPTAQNLYDKYTYHIDKNTGKPQQGDLIFLDYDRWGTPTHITHIGIYDKKLRNGKIQFIDATNYSGYDKVVDYRTINPSDVALIGYGEMKVGSN